LNPNNKNPNSETFLSKKKKKLSKGKMEDLVESGGEKSNVGRETDE